MKKEKDQKIEDQEKKVKELESKIKELESEKERYLELAKRVQANFLNYKKEEKERIEKASKEALKEFAKDYLFPLIDSLESAEKFYKDNFKDLLSGILRIKKEVLRILEALRIEKIETKGKIFDPLFHEAVAEVELPEKDEKKKGEIVEEVLAGFVDKEKGVVLRPAKVKIAKIKSS